MSKNYVKLLMVGISVTLFLVFATTVSADDSHVYEAGSIQAAVDSASSGDVIIVHEGVYHQSVVFGSEDSDITLKGKEGAILDGSEPADPDTTLGVDGIRLSAGVSNVTIEGFEIRNYTGTEVGQGNAIQAWNSGTNDITIENNVMHDNSWNAILVGNEGQGLHEGWVIEDNIVYGNGAYSLELTNIKDSVIEGNTVTGGWAGILIQARDTVPGDLNDNGLITSSNIKVENNEVSGTWWGIYVISYAGQPLDPFEPIPDTYSSLEDIKVSKNYIHDNDYYGIYLYGVNVGFAIKNAILEENTVVDNGVYDGIVLNNVEDSEVSENGVEGSGRYGISLRGGASNNLVKQNTVLYSGNLDLHWGGTGTNNVWEENEYISSNF